ncbi:peptidylprolyl isomerase [Cytophaga aurantiaca]|uniref:peptidylprolyl isomerase n=1 Tax=Cytophaga aurantiaca TaxID=29530 RepID=UPI00037BFBC9|nr:peptidylprolyl isomerase [Cytophaga aurantiaca]
MKYFAFLLAICVVTFFSFVEKKCCSVKAYHILLSAPNKTETEFEEADKLAQEIITKINAGESFAVLAKKYGCDGTAKTGGELDWFERGVMVKPFEDACFAAELNTPFAVRTQWGVHVVKVTDKKIVPCK